MRIALVQSNPTVGDVEGNLARVLRQVEDARACGAELVVFQELVLSGYPPQDLLERQDFLSQCEAALERLRESSTRWPGIGIVVGVPLPSRVTTGKRAANAAVLVEGGRIVHRHDKLLLPTYDVFDEVRHFEPGESAVPVDFGGERLGISVCEDAWNDPVLCQPPLYRSTPSRCWPARCDPHGQHFRLTLRGGQGSVPRRARAEPRATPSRSLRDGESGGWQ
jgi:NAD+ synthase (glutamine-hydrolysing)